MGLIRELGERLIEIPGVVAVTLGSRARADSDWGFRLYYRDAIRADDVRALRFEGTVVEPGDWGRLLNGGARLTGGGNGSICSTATSTSCGTGSRRQRRAGTRSIRWTAIWPAWPAPCSPVSSPWRR